MDTQPEMKLDDAKGRNNKRSEPVDPLAGTGYEHLPEIYVQTLPDGYVVHEVRPAYNILEPGTFLGTGREASMFEPDSKVITTQCPNAMMQPLNRAAALAVLKWQERLPESSAPIDIGDIAEAAQYLASDPEVLKLSTREWGKALVGTATELKTRRSDRGVQDVPIRAHNFARGAGTAPPILGAKVADLAPRMPGETRYAEAIPQYGPGAQMGAGVRRAAPSPMGASPGR